MERETSLPPKGGTRDEGAAYTVLGRTTVSRPELAGLRRWMLGTKDAHALYARHGWTSLGAPERFMERHFPYGVER